MTPIHLPSLASLPRRRLLQFDTPGSPPARFLLRLADEPRPDRVLFAVHGISREPDVMTRWLAPAADEHGYTLVAPVFGLHTFNDFQRLGRAGRGRRADLALLRIMAVTDALIGGAATPHMMGFSGGAQFGHRFVYAHPGRFTSATLVAAGWYTPPDSPRAFPYGTGRCDGLPDLAFDGEALAHTPTLVAVGARDTAIDRSVRSTARLDRQQGRHRLARAHWFQDRLARLSAAVDSTAPHRFEELPDTGHDFAQAVREGGLAETLFDFIGGMPVEHPLATARQERVGVAWC